MTPVDDTIDIILNSIKPLGKEKIDILEAYGRIIYSDVKSDINIPPLDNSAMDGFALIFSETAGADTENPLKFKIIDKIQAGGDFEGKKVLSGSAIEIMTGAPVPLGADGVIPVEYTKESKDELLIYKELKKHENIRFAGEDISIGQTVLKKGDTIKSADIGLLASLNYGEVEVYKRPRIAIISTGDEIVDVGDDMLPGQIRNSNAYTLQSEIKKYHGDPYYLGIAEDTIEKTKAKFLEAMEYDIIITTGGVSMGKYDFVKDVMADIGVNIKIKKVRMKPGKPLVFGTKDDKLFFGLPGNPVSTMVSFMQFVRPAMMKFMGSKKIEKPLVSAVLEHDIKKKPERRHYIRGYFSVKGGEISVSTTGSQGSGILRSMSEANCLIILPEEIRLVKKGEKVFIQLINHEEI